MGWPYQGMANGQLGAEDSPATPFRPFHRKQPGVARSHLGPRWRVICELQNTSVSTDLFPRANSLPSRLCPHETIRSVTTPKPGYRSRPLFVLEVLLGSARLRPLGLSWNSQTEAPCFGSLTMKRLLLFGLAWLAGSALLCVAPAAEGRPNILIILADDLGYADVGFTGGKDIKTPNLDTLAAAGARLEQFYVQPLCSPDARVPDDGALPDALRHAGRRHQALGEAGAAAGGADVAEGPQGGRLHHCHCRQVAPGHVRARLPADLARL